MIIVLASWNCTICGEEWHMGHDGSKIAEMETALVESEWANHKVGHVKAGGARWMT